MSSDTHAEKYIIRSSQRVTAAHRTGAAAALLAGWSLFLWFLAPLGTALFWYMLGEIAWHQMVRSEGWRWVADEAPWWLLVVFLSSLALFLWARINQVRFRGHEHRRRPADVDGARIAQDFGVDPVQREFWLRSRVLKVEFDKQSRIAKVVPRDIDAIGGRPAV